MSGTLDLILVIASVGLATGYLIWRKLRLARKVPRDWSSGHVEACGSCPVMEIRDKARECTQLSST